ncbi:hypothetical protein J1N10_11660 [Carboxylicivirga sp. A043]|uniref:hypothetical protein n=1 Tax=Carboxylicivirga litoralis TaxID=2816963 RepID=UPI0021CB4B50|nr:hypothetical protein [Carboxylicivirga sp. A043]MCU4156634.1 hypothetical protein [Carboxylicivirga sp. A043]
MKTLIIIVFTIGMALNGFAQKPNLNTDATPITPMQEKMLYTKFNNIGTIETYNGKEYIKYKPAAKTAYRQLVGQWQAQEISDLELTIQFKERDDYRSYRYGDRCFAENITHPSFQTRFHIRIGGSSYDDINNLKTIFFRIGPSDFAGGVNQISVSGYLHVVDANTIRMEIKGVRHPSGDNEEITIRADYTYEKTPDELLARVPKVLRRKTITFKRKGSGTGGVGITPDN